MQAGANIKMAVKGEILVIEIDLSKKQGESKSGKSQIIASTYGNVALATLGRPSVVVGVNVYEKK